MSRDLLLFLEDIEQSCERALRYAANKTFEQFQADQQCFDAVCRNLEIIGEAVKNVPEELRQRQPKIDWRRIAGLRDVLAHGYFALEPAMLWNIVLNHLPALLPAIRSALAAEHRARQLKH